MTNKLRVVFDTNVMISAVLQPNSIPFQAFEIAYRQAILLQSDATLDELQTVLSRPKFDRYVTTQERQAFLERLRLRSELVEIGGVIKVCRDPKDDKFLELAVSGQAQYIISGDKDLLELSPFRGIIVLPPAEYLNVIASQE